MASESRSRRMQEVAEDAATPIISNRAVLPDAVPPPLLTLPSISNGAFVQRSSVSHKARFSSATEQPIVMTHPFWSEMSRNDNPRQTTTRAKAVEKTTRGSLLLSPCDSTLDDSRYGALSSSLALVMHATLRRFVYTRQSHNLVARSLPAETPTAAKKVVSSMRVQGIPNYGQTCFLNAVLQSLSSLEPFMVYLERLVELNQERYEFSNFNKQLHSMEFQKRSGSVSSLLEPRDDSSLSAMLLGILQSVNGATNNDKWIDTRHLLHSIGKKYPQFRSKHGSGRLCVGKEQQDAEELLQALIAAIVDEAEFNLSSSSVPSAFVSSLASAYSGMDKVDNEFLTVAVSLRERKSKVTPKMTGEQCPAHVPPSDLLAVHESSTFSTSREVSTADLISNDFDEEKNSAQREEKKQEEFEIHVPRVYSEENMVFTNVPVEHVDNPLGDSECLSDISLREKRPSPAMQIMMTTTSSISPSPLCGWMGSMLECRKCKHVRPIQNVCSVSIPVVPTAVTNIILDPGNPPSKSSPVNAKPCKLEECLEYFTAVERVKDVECRSCTLLREKALLKDEVAMLTDAINALKKNPANEKDSLKPLEDDLHQAQIRLCAVNMASPDDDEPLEHLLRTDDLDFYEEGKKVQLERHDSFKSLAITRLPAILTIHVQRRYYDPSTNRMSKTIQHVIFPDRLDVAPYCAHGVSSGAARNGTKRPNVKRPLFYRLLSVIEHRGGAFHGHYVAYRRDPSTGRWLYISDNIVKVVDWADVCQCQAYLLFYEAVSDCYS